MRATSDRLGILAGGLKNSNCDMAYKFKSEFHSWPIVFHEYKNLEQM